MVGIKALPLALLACLASAQSWNSLYAREYYDEPSYLVARGHLAEDHGDIIARSIDILQNELARRGEEDTGILVRRKCVSMGGRYYDKVNGKTVQVKSCKDKSSSKAASGTPPAAPEAPPAAGGS